MKNLMVPNIPLALVLIAALAAVALRAAARRPQAPRPAPVTVTAGQGLLQPAVPAKRHDGTVGALASRPAPPGRPASIVDQAQRVFHELHADGRHASCAICDTQYGAA